MRFELNDEVLYDGIECQVRYINNNHCYIAPIEDDTLKDGIRLFKNCVIARLNAKGICKDGIKAYPIQKHKSGAV